MALFKKASFCCLRVLQLSLFFIPFYLFAGIKVIVLEYDNVLALEDSSLFAKNLSKIFSIEPFLLEKAIKKAKEVEKEGGSEVTFWENYAESHSIPLEEGWSKAYCHSKIDSTELNEKIAAKMKSLKEKGVKIILLSNMGALKKRILAQKGHFEMFDDIIIACEEGFSKLQPRLFEILVEKLEVLPRECLYIDNHAGNIAMAKKMGMNSLVFSPDNANFLEDLSKIVAVSL